MLILASGRPPAPSSLAHSTHCYGSSVGSERWIDGVAGDPDRTISTQYMTDSHRRAVERSRIGKSYIAETRRVCAESTRGTRHGRHRGMIVLIVCCAAVSHGLAMLYGRQAH